MAVIYSVADGGFVQQSVASAKNQFQLSGELNIPAGITLPYQHVKSAVTYQTATAVFNTAGTSTYTLTVTSTAADGSDPQTHINAQVLTPVSGETLSVAFSQASVGADRILIANLSQNSGTPANHLTLTLEG